LHPSPQRRDAFAALPPGTDAIAPLDAVSVAGGITQIAVPIAPGEGVLPAGGDVAAGDVLRKAGARLREIDFATLAAAGVLTVDIRRPCIRVINARPGDAILDAAAVMILRAIAAAGAQADMATDLDKALRDDGADAIITIGGTGSGQEDRSVIALARAGTIHCHGIGLMPGETSAFGAAGGRPVLLLPGRIDAALAVWLVLGRSIVGRLSGANDDDIAVRKTLVRKITSTVGIAEVCLLKCDGNQVEPLASGYLPLRALARADGWILVPAESEGYSAGAEIEMRPLP
jgi:molybdopterin biosynthesis enzyme